MIFTKAYLKGMDASKIILQNEKIYNSFLSQLSQKERAVSWNPDSCSLRVIDEVPFKSNIYSQNIGSGFVGEVSQKGQNVIQSTIMTNSTSIIDPM